MATEHSDNPDLRDRGYIYWRLLSADAEAAKAVVLADRPVIQDDTAALEPALQDVLIRNLSNLASVYHKPPEAFVRRMRPAGTYDEDAGQDEDDEYGYSAEEVTATEEQANAKTITTTSSVADDDLLGIGFGSAPAPAPSPFAPAPVAAVPAPAPAGGLDDLFGAPAPAPSHAAPVPSYPVLGEKDGLVMHGAFVRKGGRTVLDLVAEHRSGSGPVNATSLKFNKNSLCLAPSSEAVIFPSVAVGSSGLVSVPLTFNPAAVGTGDVVQAALRDNNSGRVLYFNIPISYGAFFVENGSLDRGVFVETWRNLAGGEKEAADIAREVATLDAEAVKSKLAAKNLFHLATRPGPDPSMQLHYYSARALDNTGNFEGASLLFELTFKQGVPAIKVTAKSALPEPFTKLACAAMKAALA
jgi:AP-1 complex subunit beta-1